MYQRLSQGKEELKQKCSHSWTSIQSSIQFSDVLLPGILCSVGCSLSCLYQKSCWLWL